MGGTAGAAAHVAVPLLRGRLEPSLRGDTRRERGGVALRGAHATEAAGAAPGRGTPRAAWPGFTALSWVPQKTASFGNNTKRRNQS